MAVREGRDSGQLRHQPNDGNMSLVRVVDIPRTGIKTGKRCRGAAQHRHRMRVISESFQKLPDVLVHVCVIRDVLYPGIVLELRGQFAISKQVRDLQKRRAFRKLLDGITPIAQDALVTVDECDGAATRRRIHERRIVGKHPELSGIAANRAEVERADVGVALRTLCAHRCGILLPGSSVHDLQAVIQLGCRCGIGLGHRTTSSRKRPDVGTPKCIRCMPIQKRGAARGRQVARRYLMSGILVHTLPSGTSSPRLCAVGRVFRRSPAPVPTTRPCVELPGSGTLLAISSRPSVR